MQKSMDDFSLRHFAAEEIRELLLTRGGICDECETLADGVPNTATNFQCNECGARAVFGISAALASGKIELRGGHDA